MRRFQSKMQRGSMQVQFGIFGGSAPGPNGGGPQAPSSPDQDDAGDGWEGTGRRIPRHEDGKTSSPSNSR